MGEQGAINSSAGNRKTLLLTNRRGNREDGDGGGGRGNHRRVGEFAGGTTAECAMVCCCCPCAALGFLVLALYKVPAGLCRKAWRRKKRERLLMEKRKMEALEDGKTTVSAGAAKGEAERNGFHEDSNSADFETEMWGRFYEGGFWRSASEKED